MRGSGPAKSKLATSLFVPPRAAEDEEKWMAAR
jgi:hypothetical protein